MARIENQNDRIVIKGNKSFLIYCFIILFMIFIAAPILFDILRFEEKPNVIEIIGVIFLIIWLIFALWMSFYSFSNLTKKIIIDKTGVTCTNIFKKQHYDWTEIKDYGLFYLFKSRSWENQYVLYFSPNKQKKINDCRKKLRGKMITTFISNSEYQTVEYGIIPFCEKFIDAEKFISVDNSIIF